MTSGLTDRPAGRGFGKLILFGEHAVVHGVPAIVAGLSLGASATVVHAAPTSLTLIDGSGRVVTTAFASTDGEPLERALQAMIFSLGVTQDVQVSVTLDVPIGVGMGSSAAMAAAVTRALVAEFDLGEQAIEAAVSASEAVFHGSASGIDQAAALTGGVFEFERGAPPKITPMKIPSVQLVVVEAGPPALTSDMVTGVANRLRRRKTSARQVLAAIREVVGEASSALQAGDWASVGELMDMNHGLLKALGVSTPELDRACEDAVAVGALGAKITGAGGGGCVIALTPNRGAEVCALLAARGWKSFTVEIS